MDQRRMTPLPDREVLSIRPARESDVDGVHALYDSLDDVTRYRRFFSPHRPQREFFERLVAQTDRDGGCVVAVLDAPVGCGDGTIVGEASYDLMANGNGEWSTVSRPEWPWVAAVLLDALLACAADHGVPNLETEVLASDESILRVIRGRPYAVIPTTDARVIRFVLGTRGDVPTWPSTGTARRVLVEGAPLRAGPGHLPRDETAVLRCPGPSHATHQCPPLLGLPCPLATGADVIVMRPTGERDKWNALRAEHATCHRAVLDAQLP